jgi:hypothetical protein
MPTETFQLLPWAADFLKETGAAIAGAGVGAWLGARYAFRLERGKAAAEHEAAAHAAANELANRRATAGNLALFTLGQIYNDLLLYDRQFLAPAVKQGAAWLRMAPSNIADRNFYRFDVPSLAFLLQSKQPGAPEMLMRLALEQDRFAAFLDTVQMRARFHEEHIPPVIERLQRENPPEHQFNDIELQEAVGPRIYAELRNYFSDIETLLQLGIRSSKALADQLRAILMNELPGQTLIGFESGASSVGSPLIQARNKAPPFGTSSDAK